MKKSKIIAPALGVLILSTAASISGTFAWFSANNTVSVSGMALTAKSDSTFLVISNTSTLDSDVELVRNISGELIPSSFTTSAIVEETETVVAANSWYTAVGTATDDGTAKAKLIAGSLSKSYPFKLDDFEKALIEKDGWVGFAASKY